MGPAAAVPIAIGAILALFVVNYLGVGPGALTQNVFTLLKLAALALLITAGLAGSSTPGSVAPAPAHAGSVVVALGAALVPVLFAFGGWQQTNFIAEEIRDPAWNLPRALLAGVTLVVVVYVLANVGT